MSPEVRPNAYKARVGRTYIDILRDNLFNIFNLVLFPMLGVIIWFGEYAVAFFAGFSVVSNALLGTIQEIVAKRRLDRLVALAAQNVDVYRDGQQVAIPASQIVQDDVMPIEPGDRLPVDGRVIATDALEMDESHPDRRIGCRAKRRSARSVLRLLLPGRDRGYGGDPRRRE